MAPESRPLLAPGEPTLGIGPSLPPPADPRARTRRLTDGWEDSPWAPQKGALGAHEEPQAPQCIAHRGYKAKQPENTMAAFRAAAAVGAHAIETDLHLSRDGVVVLSHVGSILVD